MSWLTGLEHFVRTDEPLARHTWLRLGGSADFFAEPTTVDELQTLVRRCAEQGLPTRLLGGGSNLLVPDDGARGVVIRLAAPVFGDIHVRGRRVVAGAGAKLNQVIAAAVREGLAGLETLVGIPGELGGALHGNSGTQSGDIGQWTKSATVMTRGGDILTRGPAELRFAYRQSSLDELVILSAELELEEAPPAELTRRMQTLWIVKKARQPGGGEGAACLFKDPSGLSAAALIEQAGLKKAAVGGVELCSTNPNFAVARAGARSSDVLSLLELVRDQVAQRLGVDLEPQLETW